MKNPIKESALIVAICLCGWIVAACIGGCSTPATKGWTVGGSCAICGYPLAITDSELESATAGHPYGGMVLTEDCMNPDYSHEILVTNYYPFAMPGIKSWKP